jgi:hypothetical protein
MTRPRFTIARLMVIVLLLALGLAALRTNSRKNAEITDLQRRIAQQEEEFTRQREALTSIVAVQRDQLLRRQQPSELPGGYVIAIDDARQEVVVNITGLQGARSRMKMAVFDALSPRIPNEKLKGTIVLTRVGEESSTARVLKTSASLGAIRIGDMIFSPAWSPGAPTRFALIGKIDVNRDGNDDRDELKRVIEEAGGVIEFDLPPPDVGKEIGVLTPRIDWYVTDDRTPSPRGPLSERIGEVIKEARLDGIRPMSIERLLALLGHGMGEAVVRRPDGRPVLP